MTAVVGFVETSLSGTGAAAMAHALELGAEVVLLVRSADYYTARGATLSPDLLERVRVVECDTNEPDAVAVALAPHRVCAVTSLSEYFVESAARGARLLGVRGLDPAAAFAVRRKDVTLERCRDGGVPVPRFGVAASVDAASSLATRVGMPCVVKPVDGAASVGVRLCHSDDDVRQATAAALDATHNARGQARARRVVVTEYLVGPEISAETLSEGDHSMVLALTDKELAPPPHFVETGHTVPASLPPQLAIRCAAVAVDALRAVGFDHGPAHVEMRLTDRGPVLIEINGRSAGDRIVDLVTASTGVDPLREAMRLAIGSRPRVTASRCRGAAVRFLTTPAGRITSVAGMAEVLADSAVTEVALSARRGDVVSELRSSHDRLGYVLAVGASPTEAAATADAARALIRIRVDGQ